jgi:hypothetical protein
MEGWWRVDAKAKSGKRPSVAPSLADSGGAMEGWWLVAGYWWRVDEKAKSGKTRGLAV